MLKGRGESLVATKRTRNVRTRHINPSDQREFVASPKQWQSFLQILDRPARNKPELVRLFSQTASSGRKPCQ